MHTRLKYIVPGLLVVACVWLFWLRGRETAVTPTGLATQSPVATANHPAVPAATNSVIAKDAGKLSASSTNRLAFRLSNTSRSIGQLTRDRHAILLENAFIDTTAKLDLKIPSQLKAKGDPGAFIVQAKGPTDNAFRAVIAAAGGAIVSYIPNNAYLVQMSSGAAATLTGNALVQAVLPYEPYYKVQSSLLGLAVNQQPLPPNMFLTLGIYAANANATLAQIVQLGGQILSQDRSPFGLIVRIRAPSDWLAIADLPGVQLVEQAHLKKSANDLSRVAVGVAFDTTNSANYLNLYGSNVVVEVNDTGIDAAHPDFSANGTAATGQAGPTRVTGDFASSLIDDNGHGTHVAGIIAGNGAESYLLTNIPSGSVTNADMRGKAPLASLFSVFFDESDSYLQEAPALTNALISNNSWANDGDNEYDLSAASYDAAVRDALPGVTGPQPVLFVFAAGNDGGGPDDGSGGSADTIMSPATAKNVITVGALEQFRNITNVVTALDGTSNAIWQPQTDSPSQPGQAQVAGYSACGNVGVQTEGTFGRFKPDVVAPGTFVVSTRSTTWDEKAYYNPTNVHAQIFDDQEVTSNSLTFGGIQVPINAVGLQIQLFADPNIMGPFPTNMPIYVSSLGTPDPTDPTTYDFVTSNNLVSIPPDSGGTITSISDLLNGGIDYAVGDSTNVPVFFDLLQEVITTNDLGNQLEVLSNLNNTIGPWYRYESGTSMAAGSASGVLALMQDFFVNGRNPNFSTNPSPALLKAMLINGARMTAGYQFAVTNPPNIEGWGQLELSNSIPLAFTNTAAAVTNTPLFFVDQSPTNVLSTGDRRTYFVTVPSAAAQSQMLRVTLAWTDPPGNPAAAIKLVNDLELVVTNLADGTIYYANNFGLVGPPPVSLVSSSNDVPLFDPINNVKNIAIPPLLGTNYSVTVIGQAVNVNAVTAEQTNIVQDFALVISCGDGDNTNGISVTPGTPGLVPAIAPLVTFLPSTNGIYLDQIAGANSPWLSTNDLAFGTNSPFATNAVFHIGQTNQWHFYVVTNTFAATNSAFKYAAFIVFLPDTLATPREGVFANDNANSTRPEADMELFVSSAGPSGIGDPNAALITNLDSSVISNCLFNLNGDGASYGRGGTEFVTFSNSVGNQIYYIGVQAQDQTAGEYGIVPIFSDQPFSTIGPNGDQYINGIPVPRAIPDGNNVHPGSAYVFGLALYPMEIGRVIVTNTFFHQNFGDLLGVINHNGASVVLNNHDSLGPIFPSFPLVYDDSGRGDITNFPTHSDGPGTLRKFTGEESVGPWMLTEIDDSFTQTGSVTSFNTTIEPHHNLRKNPLVIVSIPPGTWFYDYVDAGVGFTNLLVVATNLPPTIQPPLELFVKEGSPPTFTDTNYMVLLTNSPLGPYPTANDPGNSISIGPPLVPDRYFIGIFNPSPTDTATVELGAFLSFDANAISTVDYNSTGPVTLLDDAVTTDDIFVTNLDTIQEFKVGLRVDHPRISDLVFTLTDPNNNRYLLMENRGGQSTNGCGVTVITTNITPVEANGGAAAQTNFFEVGDSGPVLISYQFYTAPDTMDVYYEGTNIFSTGLVNGSGSTTLNFGPGTSTQIEVVMNATNNSNQTAWNYTIGGVQTNTYYLSFTEDTNLTTTPIKFAPPPFTPSIAPGILWTDNFDAYIVGNYVTTTTFGGGWQVLTNQVDIATDPPANSLPNELAMDNGAVSNTLPTLPGHKYILQYEQGSSATDTNVASTNANWQLVTYVFTATATNEPLILDATGDAVFGNSFSHTIVRTFGTNTVLDDFQLSLDPGDLYYQAEQSLDPLIGTSAFGDWQLEVLDNRAGATNFTPTLVSWQLEFEFANTNLPFAGLPPGSGFNVVGANSIQWYQVNVPVNALATTNTLVFATLPVNLWYSTNLPPTITNSADLELFTNITSGTYVISTNTTPVLMPGTTYFIGVQNTNNIAVTNEVQVDFLYALADVHLRFIPTQSVVAGNTLVVTNTATDTNAGAVLTYSLTTSPVTGALIDTNGIITWQTTTNDAQTNVLFTTIAIDTFNGLSATNSFDVFVSDALTNGMAVTNITESNSITWYLVQVPYNALAATNTLLFATLPVNMLYSTNVPPTVTSNGDFELLTNAISGVSVIDTNSMPLLVPNSFYYLGVQNTNNIAVTNAVEVDFLLGPSDPGFPVIPNQTVIGGETLVVTNTATDTNAGAVLVYTLANTSPATATIDTNGIITWPTTTNMIGLNVTITTIATDTFTGLSATNSFGVSVVENGLTNGVSVTNIVGANSIAWFQVQVPINAFAATNTLLFATLPVNLWYSVNVPPTITSSADFELLTNVINGVSVISTNSMPVLVPGSTYYLGVQNTNNIAVTNALEVDFLYGLVPPVLPVIPAQTVAGGDTLVVTNTATDINIGATLGYTLSTVPATTAAIDGNGIITWATTTNDVGTDAVITTIVTDSFGLSATNSFEVEVLPPFNTSTPVTNVVGANSVQWYKIKVPNNALAATNTLLFATLPVNLWYSTHTLPTTTNSTDFELLTNVISGVSVITTSTVPRLIPGSSYYLGVQNTNNVAVTNAVEVDFLLKVPPVFTISSVTATNIGGTNGFLITWLAPTNDQFHLEWTPQLAPANWKDFKGVISYISYLSPTGSQFSYFDDGSQTGGFDPMRFYRLKLLNSPTNTAPFFVNGTPAGVAINPSTTFSVTNLAADYDIPAQSLSYSLTTDVTGTNIPTVNANFVISWTPDVSQAGTTNHFTTVVADDGVPVKSVTNSFTIIVNATNALPTFSQIVVDGGGVHLVWLAPTSDVFEVRWTTNLASPINWSTFPGNSMSGNGTFIFTDTNLLGVMKFYQLFQLP